MYIHEFSQIRLISLFSVEIAPSCRQNRLNTSDVFFEKGLELTWIQVKIGVQIYRQGLIDNLFDALATNINLL